MEGEILELRCRGDIQMEMYNRKLDLCTGSPLGTNELLFGVHIHKSNLLDVCMLSRFSHVFAIPWTSAHQAPFSMGFSSQEYWSGLSFTIGYVLLLLHLLLGLK